MAHTLTLDRNARASGYQQAFERSPYDISQLAQQNQLVDMERLSSQQPMQHSGLGSMVWHPDSLGRDAPAQMRHTFIHGIPESNTIQRPIHQQNQHQGRLNFYQHEQHAILQEQQYHRDFRMQSLLSQQQRVQQQHINSQHLAHEQQLHGHFPHRQSAFAGGDSQTDSTPEDQISNT